MSIEEDAKYTKLFIAIILPGEYLTDFNQLFAKTQNILRNKYKPVHPTFPHMTLMLLADRAAGDLARIRSVVEEGADIINGEILEIGGFGIFPDSNGKPAAIYLSVAHSDNLCSFQKHLVTELDDLQHPTIKHPFVPHVTALKIPYGETRREVLKQERPLREALGSISWRFQATQIDIMARKSIQGHKPETGSIDTIVLKSP